MTVNLTGDLKQTSYLFVLIKVPELNTERLFYYTKTKSEKATWSYVTKLLSKAHSFLKCDKK